MATLVSLPVLGLAFLALAMGHVPPPELERGVDQCALGFACAAFAALWEDSQMLRLVGNGTCLGDRHKSFREGQKKQEEDDAKRFRKCARDKLHQQLSLQIDQAEQADASNRKKCIQSSVHPCLQACHQKAVSDQIACIRSRGYLCTRKAVSACKPPKQHFPAGAYPAAMKECGYRFPSILSSDKMSEVVSNMVCNREGGELMEKFLIEEEEAMGERHLLIFVEVDAKEVVRMETYDFEQQVSAALKELQHEAKRAEAKEEEKIEKDEKADMDAGQETESVQEPEAKPEGKGGAEAAEGGVEGAAEEAGAIAWSILKAPFKSFNATRSSSSSRANLSDANREAQTVESVESVERQSLRKMNKEIKEDKKVDKSVNQSESNLLKYVKAQYDTIFPLMQFGLAVLLAMARPRAWQSISSGSMTHGTPFTSPLLSSAAS